MEFLHESTDCSEIAVKGKEPSASLISWHEVNCEVNLLLAERVVSHIASNEINLIDVVQFRSSTR